MQKLLGIFFISILLSISFYNVGSVVVPYYKMYITPYYDEHYFKMLENDYNHSQYRVKKNPGIISDYIVFSYAAGAYLRGLDPILVNSEITPLGKYFIALSILFFKNDNFIIVVGAVSSLIMIWLLGRKVLGDSTLALVPVVLFSSEKLFLNQLINTPLLDIIQLPFILLSFYLFILEYKKQKFLLTAIAIGLVMATKTIMPGLLIIACFGIFLMVQRQWRSVFHFVLALPLAGILFTATYIQTFRDGYSFWDFIKFQKWIFNYQRSKLIFPLSFWRLVMLNQWQAWWGNMSILKADDWQITWPIFTSLPFVLVILNFVKKINITSEVWILLLWCFMYEVFLSLGVVSSRYLLLLLPMQYVIGVYLAKVIYKKLT